MAMPHAQPGQPIDLAPLGDTLKEAATHAILKTRSLELIRLVLPQGKATPPHSVAGECTILCLEGELAVVADGDTCRLETGQIVLLPAGIEHAVHAVSPASALLTIQIPPGAPGSGSSTG